MTTNKNKGTNPLAILAAVSLSLMGSQLGTAAIASDGGAGPQQPGSNISQSANQYLMAQNQQQCTVNSPSDVRGGADLRNNPTGQNTGFINNGTTVNAEKLSDDGQWRWVVTPDGSQRGWIFQAYLKCSGEAIRQGSSNTTGGIAIGTMCSATGSPDYPTIPIQDFPNAQSNNIGDFAKGTQLRVVTPPEGQASPRKWTYVQSVQNPGQQGWVWRTYVSCN